MRNLLGGVVLVGGVAIVGWWASTHNAVRMQDSVSAAALAAAEGATHPLTIEVSGRDISVAGLVDNAEAKQQILGRMNDVEGRRVVVDDLTILPVAAPYKIGATNDRGQIMLRGNVPTEAMRAEIAASTGLSADGLVLASGERPAEWLDVAGQGVAAVKHLQFGAVSLVDQHVLLEGQAALPADRAAALAEFENLPDGFTFVERVSVEDDGTPMRLNMALAAGEVAMSDSKLPMGMTVDDVAMALGLGTGGDAPVVAKIAGDTPAFGDAAKAGSAALGALETGELSLVGNTLMITGTATRAGKTAALAALSGLGDDVTVTENISFSDDGKPFSLNADFDAIMVNSSGKLPYGVDPNLASMGLGVEPGSAETMVAEIDDASGTWADAANSALMAAKNLDAGSLMIEGNSVTLNGTATRAGKDAALAALSNLPAGYEVSQDIAFSDDGRPFQLMVEYDGDAATASGKLPYGMALGDVAASLGADASGDVDVAEISSDGDAWPMAADQGLQALSKMQNGTLAMEGQSMTLSGLVLTPDNGTQISNLLNGLPAGFSANTEFDYVDDGSAPSFDVEYSVDRGASVSGKLPAGLTAPDIAEALNLTSIQSTATEGLTGAPDAATEAIAKLSAWLPELDQAILSTDESRINVAAIAAPGVDMELLQSGLAADFPDAVDVKTAANLPDNGADRINALSGLREVFTGVAWVPAFDFAATVEACERASIDVLQSQPVAFVSGGSRLDARSMRGINALAGLLSHCAEGTEFVVEVAGHTDSQGSESGNQALSQARAQSVYDALVERGVPSDMVSAVGYGESTPIADNETEEGRAANRRTELVWSEAPEPATEETEETTGE